MIEREADLDLTQEDPSATSDIVHSEDDDHRIPQPRGPDHREHAAPLAESAAPSSDTGETATATDYPTTSRVDLANHLEQRRLDAIREVCAKYAIEDPEKVATVKGAHQLVSDYHAPFVVDRLLDILDHCRADVAAHPGTKVVFLGRDGDSLALAARELDPEFYDKHCTSVTLSRCLADCSVQDMENLGKSFPELKGFRTAAGDVDPGDVDGARARQIEYLESRKVPVGTPGARIILIDTSFRGTVQNLLAATHSSADFHGKYLFYSESEGDPHASQKTGFALHRRLDGTDIDPRAATEQPTAVGPTPLSIFAEKDSVLALEQILRGSLSKAVRIVDGTPEQHLESPPLNQINPLEVADRYRDDQVRLAVMDINQLAVADYAAAMAALRRDGGSWRAEMGAKAEEFVNQVGSWCRRDSDIDPALAEFLGSFVRREDKELVAELHGLIEERHLDSDVQWQAYQDCGSLAEKSAYVDNVRKDTPASGGASHG
ncbi:hypothetical protein DFR70_1011074 [Nocardia tenerifensis]|uniref:Uncharacterized protein n=2 Tax=Nocardia tenerifensis TaxID=228006 RepID=A0A318KPR0_9NOCA|nr:hypothetical protein DFR70_1011074 [Nocardia tenerifensis]